MALTTPQAQPRAERSLVPMAFPMASSLSTTTNPTPLLQNAPSPALTHARTVADRRWRAVDQWERAAIISRDQERLMTTRGAWIDDCLHGLLEECARHDFHARDEQQLRDVVFDFIRALSRH